VQIYKDFFFSSSFVKLFSILLLYFNLKINTLCFTEISTYLFGLIIATGIWQFTESNIGNEFSSLLVLCYPIFLYFKNEFILLAFLKLRKQDFEGAKKWLAYIKTETALVQNTRIFNYLHQYAFANQYQSSREIFQKAIELDYLWIWIL
jgi:hypothetical protein